MHEVLVNRLGGLSLPRKSVVRLTDRPDMTLDVYRGRKTTIQQQQQSLLHFNHCNDLFLYIKENSWLNVIIFLFYFIYLFIFLFLFFIFIAIDMDQLSVISIQRTKRIVSRKPCVVLD